MEAARAESIGVISSKSSSGTAVAAPAHGHECAAAGAHVFTGAIETALSEERSRSAALLADERAKVTNSDHETVNIIAMHAGSIL